MQHQQISVQSLDNSVVLETVSLICIMWVFILLQPVPFDLANAGSHCVFLHYKSLLIVLATICYFSLDYDSSGTFIFPFFTFFLLFVDTKNISPMCS